MRHGPFIEPGAAPESLPGKTPLTVPLLALLLAPQNQTFSAVTTPKWIAREVADFCFHNEPLHV